MMQCGSCGFNISNDNALFCPRCGTKTNVSSPNKFPHNISKVWSEWELEKQIGKGSYGVVYQAVRTDDFVENRRAAIKIISIPTDQSEIDSLRSEGLDYEKSRTYFKDIVDEFVKEIEVMESLKGMQNIVSVEDYKVIEKTDEIGWDIYIRMELLTPLNTYAAVKNLTESDVIALGVDMCTALEYCNKIDIIHRDIKPENIFVNDFGDFKLGDFGIARKLENQTGAFSQKGTYGYMAPEVFYRRHYDSRADIYSLGIVLYRLLNSKMLPFVDSNKQLISPGEKTEAIERRLNGEALPAPKEASKNMANLILCACRYDPEKRFTSASVMKKALESVTKNNYEQYAEKIGVLQNSSEAQAAGGNNNVIIPSNNVSQVQIDETKKQGSGTSKTLRLFAVAALVTVLIAVCVSGGIFVGVKLLGETDESTSAVNSTEEPATVKTDNYYPSDNQGGYYPSVNNSVPVSIIDSSGENNLPGTTRDSGYVQTTIIVDPTTSESDNGDKNLTTTTTTTTTTTATTTAKPEKQMPSSKAEVINFYKDAVNNIKNFGAAGYSVKKWQAIDEVNLGIGMVNSAAVSIIENFITTESDAYEEAYSRGTNQARSNFPAWNLADNSNVRTSSCVKHGENYRITIVMDDEDTPTKSGSVLAQVSDSIYYWEEVDEILSNNSVVTKVLNEYDNVHIYYRNYTITADVTPDGEFISVVHSSDIEVFIGYANVMGVSFADKSAFLWTTTKYYNFTY